MFIRDKAQEARDTFFMYTWNVTRILLITNIVLNWRFLNARNSLKFANYSIGALIHCGKIDAHTYDLVPIERLN